MMDSLDLSVKHRTKLSNAVPDYCRVMKFKDANGQVKEMVFPKGLDLDRPKRPRTTFTNEQLAELEQRFGKKQYLVGSERAVLAKQLKLSETQIKVWFQNRRTKCKRDRTDREDSDTSLENSTSLSDCHSPSSQSEHHHHQSVNQSVSQSTPATLNLRSPQPINMLHHNNIRCDTSDWLFPSGPVASYPGILPMPPNYSVHAGHMSNYHPFWTTHT